MTIFNFHFYLNYIMLRLKLEQFLEDFKKELDLNYIMLRLKQVFTQAFKRGTVSFKLHYVKIKTS